MAKIFIATASGFLLGAVFMALGNRQAPAPARRERWKKFAVYFLIVHITLAAAVFGAVTTLLFFVAILASAAVELRRATRAAGFGGSGQGALVWAVFVAVASTIVVLVPKLSAENWVYLYLLVAVFDGFSQVVGQLAGRHRLAPRLSPGKTVEGALGGLAAALVIGYLFRNFAWPAPAAALLLAALVALAALAGDLSASWVKRRAGIKDFGAALPGQGGVLDRFDSLLAAAALAGPLIYFSAGASA